MKYHTDCQSSTHHGGIISAVAPASIAEELELQPGDVVLAVNDLPLRDIIDYRFAIASEQVELFVRGSQGSIIYEIEKAPDDDLGITFGDPLFDPLRICKNRCPFCFLAQMPRGLRKTLYLKDDDFRLSFLYGNFVTLTNLTEADWQRIGQQHLSPLHISVHATDNSLRAFLLGKREIPDIRQQIRRLGHAGIEVHTQVVLCPGLNDGDALHQTVQELAALYPVVQSIAVVPVGLTQYGRRRILQSADTTTCHHPQSDYQPTSNCASDMSDWGYCARLAAVSNTPLRCYTPTEAAHIIDLLQPYSQYYQCLYGLHLVYPGDEFYLMSQRKLPPASFYDGYPQYSNGVGMTRELLNTWLRLKRRLRNHNALTKHTSIALVCGTLIAPTLQHITRQMNHITGVQIEVLPVVNTFFGETVTVSGLLVGQDVISALRASQCTTAMLPRVMFDHTGIRTLDEYNPQHIADEAGLPVHVISDLDELVRHVIACTKGLPTTVP